ncbi:hypothetical protein LWI29_002679 [Acer saccharum]|uniref:Uncharacterized protein n=1 Tax=Acer saccharum TaxID=4024 RepID=A0AA39T936_ACESA|nr:hypothetical protein LWI29_002679 [Acer saccharum]
MDKEFFSGKLCHMLLCRELNYPGECPDEMWFRVGERAVRFGNEEFLLVTGLRFRPMPYWAMEAIPVLSGSVGKRRRGRNGHGFPRLTRWFCQKKPPQLEHKFTDELEAYTTLTPTAEERLQEYYRQFNPLVVVGPELHMHGGYDLENEAGHCETRSKGGYDNDLRSYIESWFEQIDLKIDKLLADRVHVPVPVPLVLVPPVPPIPVTPQPTWSAGYTSSYAVKTFRTYLIHHAF